MKHNFLYTLSLCLLSTLFFFSCTKDKGNYDYRDLNEITIEGMEDHYYFTLNRNGKITPTLTFKQGAPADMGRFKYEWTIDKASGYSISKSILSTEKDLDTIIRPQLGSASYYCYFRVTDTVTGIFAMKEFMMHVSTPAYEGWLLLCEPSPGTSRLDMVSMSGDRETFYKDVLAAVGSTYPLTGTPSFVTSGPVYYPPARGLVAPLIGTSADATILGLDTLEYLPSYSLNNMLTGERIQDFTNSNMFSRFSGTILYAQKSVYYSTYSSSIIGPVSVYQGSPEPISINPMVAHDNYGSNWIFFDDDANQFIRYATGNAFCRTIPAGPLFDYQIDNNFPGGMSLVWFGSIVRNPNSSEVFAILKANTSGKYYLARFNLTGTAQSQFEEIQGATDLSLATHFAVSPEYGYIFYNVNGKVYEYDYVLKRSFLMHDYGTTRKVSVFQFPYLNFSDIALFSSPPVNSDRYSRYRRMLMVATYDPADQANSGEVDLYTVPGVNQPIQLYRSYSGTGKVVSAGFRER